MRGKVLGITVGRFVFTVLEGMHCGFWCSGTDGLRTACADRCWLCTGIHRSVEKLWKLGHVVQKKGLPRGRQLVSIVLDCIVRIHSPEVFRPEEAIRICHYQCCFCFCRTLDWESAGLNSPARRQGYFVLLSCPRRMSRRLSINRLAGRVTCSGVGGAQGGVGRWWLWLRLSKPEKMVFGAET